MNLSLFWIKYLEEWKTLQKSLLFLKILFNPRLCNYFCNVKVLRRQQILKLNYVRKFNVAVFMDFRWFCTHIYLAE